MRIYIYILIGIFLIVPMVNGQVGVNINTPKATLDVAARATNGSRAEGLLAPRLTGDQIKTGDGQYGSAQEGMIVYATSAVSSTSPKTINITSEGYYFFDGSIWQKVTPNIGGWSTKGTSGTTVGTNFIGTTNNTDLVMKTNNLETLRFTNSQKLLVGTSTVPVGGTNSKVIIDNGTVNGGLHIRDGNQCDGCLLRGDLNGVGTWTKVQDIARGVFPGGSQTVAGTKSGIYKYSQTYIDLPPGKWMVNVGLTLFVYDKFWLHARLSSSNTAVTNTGFSYLGIAGNNSAFAGVMHNGINTNGDYSFLSGSTLINITGTATQRIYLMIEDPNNSSLVTNGSGQIYQYVTTNYENYFYAIPLN
jgi:hypothetical protein